MSYSTNNTKSQKQAIFVMNVTRIEKNKTNWDTLSFFDKSIWNFGHLY